MKSLIHLLPILTLVIMAGCATVLKPGAEQIALVTDEVDAESYLFIGDVYGTGNASMYGGGHIGGVKSARAAIRNKALEMGADTVKIDSTTTGKEMLAGQAVVTISGRAYRKK